MFQAERRASMRRTNTVPLRPHPLDSQDKATVYPVENAGRKESIWAKNASLFHQQHSSIRMSSPSKDAPKLSQMATSPELSPTLLMNHEKSINPVTGTAITTEVENISSTQPPEPLLTAQTPVLTQSLSTSLLISLSDFSSEPPSARNHVEPVNITVESPVKHRD